MWGRRGWILTSFEIGHSSGSIEQIDASLLAMLPAPVQYPALSFLGLYQAVEFHSKLIYLF